MEETAEQLLGPVNLQQSLWRISVLWANPDRIYLWKDHRGLLSPSLEGALLAGEASPEEGSGPEGRALPPGLETQCQVAALVTFSTISFTYCVHCVSPFLEYKFHEGKDFPWFFYFPNI